METTVHTLAEFEAEATRFAKTLAPAGDGATLVTLSGTLGAGKTAFTKALAKALGVETVVNSPTFVLEKIYALPEGAPFAKLIHIDAYRLSGGSELPPLGFDEAMRERTNLIVLEWPEQVQEALPKPAHTIAIESLEDGSRRITYGN